jgi:ParB-like chromosome segregation protein Spo0J
LPARDPAPDLGHIAEPIRPLAVPCAELDFHPQNPRRHREADQAALRASLREFGQLKPVVANARTSPPQVVAGNGLLQAALSLGWTHVACVRVDLDESKAAAYAIADNRTSELSAWDDDNLKDLLAVAQTADQDLADMFTRLAEVRDLLPKEAKGEQVATSSTTGQTSVLVCPHCGNSFAPPEPGA